MGDYDSITCLALIDLMEYLTRNQNKQRVEIRILRCHFEWQGRPWCMAFKYNKAFTSLLCQWYMQTSLFTRWALGAVETAHSGWKCIITSCTGVKGAHKLLLTLHTCRPWSFFATQNSGIVSSFPSTTCPCLVARDTDINCIMSVTIRSHFAYISVCLL